MTAAALLAACADVPATPIPGAPAHHVEGGFRNDPATPAPDAVAFAFDRLRLAVIPNPEARERLARQSSAAARAAWNASGDADAVLWIGHAIVLVRLGGKTLLFDPIFADHATPVPPIGPRRLVPPGVALADLPRIDAILVSHDHYDHFEPSAIRSIAARDRPLCLLPLGVGGRENFGCARTERLDWGGEARLGTDDVLAARTDVPRAAAAAGIAADRVWVLEPGEARRF
jgi:N-acyl-phosphatidylethanolamine-hydrolysing phospholipase D